MISTPVVLFVYNRVVHTRRTVESLLGNASSSNSDLIIFSDGPKSCDNSDDVQEVRDYISTIEGFKSVKIHSSEINKGLAESIIYGVTDVLTDYDSVIVLEDDMVVSPHFLSYMNDGLQKYQHEDRVISIHGYVYPTKEDLPQTFFLRGADCWGWATWRRGWDLFNPNGKVLYEELKRKKLLRVFNFNGAYQYSKLLLDQINGKNESWAVRWYASAFLLNKLTLYPGSSLVHNIGNDSSGTHCLTNNHFDTQLSTTPLGVENIVIKESIEGKKAIECYFRTQHYLFFRSLFSRMIKFCLNYFSSFAKHWLPPVLQQKLTRRKMNSFDGPFSSWEEAEKGSAGYNSDLILEKVLKATLSVKNGEAVYERDSVLFDDTHYSWPVLSGLMWTAARFDGRLSVLDFGGSLGSSYFQNRNFLSSLNDLQWSVIEQDHYVVAGQKFIQDDSLSFYSTIKECVTARKPNVVILSSVLQYLKDPYSILEELCQINVDVILIDMTIVSNNYVDDVYIQNVPQSIYEASYPVRSLSRQELIKSIENFDYRMITDFDTLDFPQLVKLDSDFKGFIFSKTNNE